MKKITGGITFITGIAGVILLLLWIFEENVFKSIERGLAWTGLFLLALSVIHFTVTMKFWTSKLSIIESLDRETEIIKKKIELKELLAKLENLEKNE